MATAVAAPGLTAEQQAALDTRDVRVALSAGAGCGKTFVLTERFLSHLQPDAGRSPAAQLDRLIAITFTERAAREMRDRVRKKVRERLTGAADEAESAHWLEIFRRLDTAQISTIHSFCGTLLRGHAVEAGIDPRFGVLEPTEAGAIVAELIDDELRRRLADRDADMLDLAADYDLAGVRAMIDDVLGERYRLRFADWLDVTPEALAARWKAFHAKHVLPELRTRLLGEPAWGVLRRTYEVTPPPHPVLEQRCRDLFDTREKLACEPGNSEYG
jgi:ATP-dependent helicase/nuclease subunit A